MGNLTRSVWLLAGLASFGWGGDTIVLDRSHESRVFNETRHYRIFLPRDYETSGKRYPVIYWFHGYGERYNRGPGGREYDSGASYGGDNIANFVGGHDVIVVKWDGFNPRTPAEDYSRPYNIGPVETDRQFPLYFPELIGHIDTSYRTIADREHRATSGLSMGGFMSYWIAGKYPDLVSSASNFMGSSEFTIGPRSFPVEYRHDEMRGNYEGLRTRLVIGKRDFIQFYHRRMNLFWDPSRVYHETEEFDSEHGVPGIAKTFDFHMRAFDSPLPKPEVWNHIDVYPQFSVWDWKCETSRQRPGFTVFENVSRTGFRSSVREWLPGGRILGDVRLSIASAPIYAPGSDQPVTAIRIRGGMVLHEWRTADAEGRLHFDLDGEEWEVGIGAGPILALAGYGLNGAQWAEDGQPVRLRALLWNKGARASAPVEFQWETPDSGVRITMPRTQVDVLEPGKRIGIPFEFVVSDPARELVRLTAAVDKTRLSLEIPVFPAAPAAPRFEIADHRSLPVFQRAIKLQPLTLGEGNGDGKANPDEQIVILLPDGHGLRAAELFTNDACMDLTERGSDSWTEYDHVGASSKYTVAKIRGDCPPDHVVRALARVLVPNQPNHRVRYATVEFPVVSSATPQ